MKIIDKLSYLFKLNCSRLLAVVFADRYEQFWSLYNFCSWKDLMRKRARKARILDFSTQNREVFYTWISEQIGSDKPIDYIELGVFQGDSFKKWLAINTHPDSRFFGFDSFEGLPEQWGENPVGTFNVNGAVPEISDARGKFIKGGFQETLPDFVRSFRPENQLVIHLDADLYSSTLFALTQLDPFIVDGTVLIFDEFSDINHEFAALREFVKIGYRKWSLMGGNRGFHKAAIKVGDRNSET